MIECKILRGGLEDTIRKGLIQTLRYMDQCAAREGHLVLFDRAKRHWKDKVFRQSEAVEGTTDRGMGHVRSPSTMASRKTLPRIGATPPLGIRGLSVGPSSPARFPAGATRPHS